MKNSEVHNFKNLLAIQNFYVYNLVNGASFVVKILW